MNRKKRGKQKTNRKRSQEGPWWPVKRVLWQACESPVRMRGTVGRYLPQAVPLPASFMSCSLIVWGWSPCKLPTMCTLDSLEWEDLQQIQTMFVNKALLAHKFTRISAMPSFSSTACLTCCNVYKLLLVNVPSLPKTCGFHLMGWNQ